MRKSLRKGEIISYSQTWRTGRKGIQSHPVGFGVNERKQTGIRDMTHSNISTVDPPVGECHGINDSKNSMMSKSKPE